VTAQPVDRIPASGPDTGSYEVIHLGGQPAVVVPVSDFLAGARGRRGQTGERRQACRRSGVMSTASGNSTANWAAVPKFAPMRSAYFTTYSGT
jgi:hypothetical protein